MSGVGCCRERSGEAPSRRFSLVVVTAIAGALLSRAERIPMCSSSGRTSEYWYISNSQPIHLSLKEPATHGFSDTLTLRLLKRFTSALARSDSRQSCTKISAEGHATGVHRSRTMNTMAVMTTKNLATKEKTEKEKTRMTRHAELE